MINCDLIKYDYMHIFHQITHNYTGIVIHFRLGGAKFWSKCVFQKLTYSLKFVVNCFLIVRCLSMVYITDILHVPNQM